MKQTKIISLVYLIVLATVFSCKSGNRSGETQGFDSINLNAGAKPINPLDTMGEGLPIFYNMYLSVEMSSLFETSGTVFNKEILNSEDKISDYITSSKKALNLGVYAVDLTYARAFDQFEVAGRYFNGMQTLSEQLGIPSDYFTSTAQRFERNMTNKDSLIKIANEVYVETEDYLAENERYSTASLIILGGWVEAIYIAANVALDSKDPNIIERFTVQKHSLDNLLIMLEEHKADEVVAEYFSNLEKFKKSFSSLKDEPDESENEEEANQAFLEYNLAQIEDLNKELNLLRDKIIE